MQGINADMLQMHHYGKNYIDFNLVMEETWMGFGFLHNIKYIYI